jgi:hypothetical protein
MLEGSLKRRSCGWLSCVFGQQEKLLTDIVYSSGSAAAAVMIEVSLRVETVTVLEALGALLEAYIVPFSGSLLLHRTVSGSVRQVPWLGKLKQKRTSREAR